MFNNFKTKFGSYKPGKSKILEDRVRDYTVGSWSPVGPSNSTDYARVLHDMKSLNGVSDGDARDAFRVFVTLTDN